MADVELLCAGRLHTGWEGMRLARSMENCANSFELQVSELWPGQETRWAITPGAKCAVRLAGATVISGYVDRVQLSMDAAAHGVEVSGRDAAADLVDCSVVTKGGQWLGKRVEAIAAMLAAPFGIRVRAAVDTGKPLPSFALQEGETAFEAIDRAARMRALLVVSDGQGGIAITRASTRRIATPLVLGRNVLSAQVEIDLRERFSRYIAKGQRGSLLHYENDPQGLRQAFQVRAEASDPEVTRYRPLVITGECQDVAASLQQRVQWEANVRAARSTEVTIRVQGWSHAGGLWEPNTLVRVELGALRVTGDLLIKSCRYELGASGTTTELQLTRADAFTILPLKPPVQSALAYTLPSKDAHAQGH